MFPFGLRHGVPLPFLVSVPRDVVYLCEQIKPNIGRAKGDKCSVSTTIARLVVVAVNIRRGDARGLDKHVVKRCRDSACTDCVAVAGIPANLDRVR